MSIFDLLKPIQEINRYHAMAREMATKEIVEAL